MKDVKSEYVVEIHLKLVDLEAERRAEAEAEKARKKAEELEEGLAAHMKRIRSAEEAEKRRNREQERE